MITVVSCVWQRLERLQHTLMQLEAQTFRGFELQLINNNYDFCTDVERIADRNWSFNIGVTHNVKNRGPFARIELMRELAREADCRWFMTLDDDAEFDADLIGQWWDQRDAAPLQGWNGFKFLPRQTYWDRTQVNPGAAAHYVWGSNMFLSSQVVLSDSVTQLDAKWWQCDDLWLCYHTQHMLGLPVNRGHITGFRIEIDGKDTYLTQHSTKVRFLDELRSRGWAV